MTETRRGAGALPQPPDPRESGQTSAQLSHSPCWDPEDTPHSPALCFQRLTAIQQVLKAQKISFLLRGGVRVVVAVRDVDTGEGPGRARLCKVGWVGIQAPQMTLATVYTGGRGGPSADHMSLLAGWSSQLNPGQPCCPLHGRMELLL